MTTISGGIANLISGKSWLGVPKLKSTDLPTKQQPLNVLVAQAKERNELLKKMNKGRISPSERGRLTYLMKLPEHGEDTWKTVGTGGVFKFPGPQRATPVMRAPEPDIEAIVQPLAPPKQEVSFVDKVSQEVMRSELSDLRKSYATLERVVVKNTALIQRETDHLKRLRASLKGLKRDSGKYKIITEQAKETNARITAAKNQLQTVGDYKEVLTETKSAIKYYEDELAKIKPTSKPKKPKKKGI
jgi:hypothetical protein